MILDKPISMLTEESNLALLKGCLEKGKKETTRVLDAGELVRKMHETGHPETTKAIKSEAGPE